MIKNCIKSDHGLSKWNFYLMEVARHTFLKMTLSGAMMEVLHGREVDLVDGKETAALTAAAICESS